MSKYVVRKLLFAIVTIFLVMTLNFTLIHVAPGDPITTLLGPDNQDPEARAEMMAAYGLDKPLHIQYAKYISQLLKGNLGDSIIYHTPVSELIGSKIGATVMLVFTAAVISLIVGVLMGITAGRREGSFFDRLFSYTSYTFNAMPSFWLGLMVIIVFATRLKWFPSSGMINARAHYTGFRHTLDVLYHMCLPLLTLLMLRIPGYFRTTKSSVLQVNSEDYITTFKATGMNEKKIFRKYVFKNAILPVVTSFGISLAFLITGVSLIEIVFAWPGTGRVMLNAINQRDYPVLMGVYLIMSVMVAIMMIVVDIVYALLDPRIRY